MQPGGRTLAVHGARALLVRLQGAVPAPSSACRSVAAHFRDRLAARTTLHEALCGAVRQPHGPSAPPPGAADGGTARGTEMSACHVRHNALTPNPRLRRG